MATTASGITIPGASPTTTAATPLQDLWNNLGKSLNGRIIVPVTSISARSALVASLTSEGYVVSAANPIYVHRADAPAGFRLEVCDDASSWTAVRALAQSGVAALEPATLASGTGATNGGAVVFATPFAAIPDVQVTLRSGQSGTGFLAVRALNVTAAGFSVYAYNTGPASTSWTGNLNVGWRAQA